MADDNSSEDNEVNEVIVLASEIIKEPVEFEAGKKYKLLIIRDNINVSH